MRKSDHDEEEAERWLRQSAEYEGTLEVNAVSVSSVFPPLPPVDSHQHTTIDKTSARSALDEDFGISPSFHRLAHLLRQQHSAASSRQDV
jgi:hypothetical protein